jgi:glycosyltransferase involved in cell wall biosynthesis
MSEGAPLTVLLLSDYGGPYRGSFVPMLTAIAREGRRAGWKVACGFTPVAAGREWLADLEAEGTEVRFAARTSKPQLRAWLEEWLDELSGPVVIHTHFTAFDLPAVAAARAQPDVAVLWHVHAFLPKSPARIPLSVIKYGWLGRWTARTICVSAGTANAIRRRGGSRRRTIVVENGIDTERFDRVSPAEREQARAELSIPGQGPVLLHFAWDWQVKGGPLFAQTLAALRSAGTPAVGVTIGGGAEARAEAMRLGLGEALIAVEPSDDVRAFYAAADVLLATSAAEGAPFALLEALSCGTPVVGTEIPGHRLAGGGPAALRLGDAVPERLAELVAAALEQPPDEREAEAAEAHDWVVRNRGVDGWAREIGSLYAAAAGS